MGIRITALNAKEIGAGIWSFDMPPHQVRHFGEAGHAVGTASVILLTSHEYDAERLQLQFSIEDAVPVNVGTTSEVIGISAIGRREKLPGIADEHPSISAARLGPGDREFLRLAREELSERTAKAAEGLLYGVRERSAGNLKRGQSKNFSETPDNFWYVIVQPRVDELSITVRGSVEHFAAMARLEIKDDRGNTRFKVRSEADVPAALQIIFCAIRKR